jgi:hypothetical protein
LALAKNFPRDEYALPGFTNLLEAVRVAFLSLIDLTPVAEAWNALANTDVFLDRAEWEYGVGPIAFLLIVAGAAALIARGGRMRRHLPALAAIIVTLALPLLLNWYVPAWNALLKQMPLLGSSTTLVRWFMLYIPVVVLLAALAFDALFARGVRAPVMALAVLAIAAPNALVEKGTYRAQHYDATPIVTAWHTARTIPVTDIIINPQSTPQRRVRLGGNNAIAGGHSQLYCYAPVFGYQLEALPIGSLHPGPISDLSPDGALNLKNPSCYLFPGANSCRPGDEFTVEQAGAADAFAHYEPFSFALSALQTAANWVNFLALIGFVLAVPILMWRNRSRGASFRGLDAMPPAR